MYNLKLNWEINIRIELRKYLNINLQLYSPIYNYNKIIIHCSNLNIIFTKLKETAL